MGIVYVFYMPSPLKKKGSLPLRTQKDHMKTAKWQLLLRWIRITIFEPWRMRISNSIRFLLASLFTSSCRAVFLRRLEMASSPLEIGGDVATSGAVLLHGEVVDSGALALSSDFYAGVCVSAVFHAHVVQDVGADNSVASRAGSPTRLQLQSYETRLSRRGRQNLFQLCVRFVCILFSGHFLAL